MMSWISQRGKEQPQESRKGDRTGKVIQRNRRQVARDIIESTILTTEVAAVLPPHR